MQHSSLQAAFLVILAFGASGRQQVNGQDESGLTSKQIRQSLLQQAKDYRIRLPKSDVELKLYERSLLNWSNPQRTTEEGIVQLWTDDGMPVVIASLFTYEYMGTRLKHEFISLTDQPVLAQYNGRRAWTPREPGLRLRDLPGDLEDKQSMATSSVRRLVQMRRIAAKFEFEVTSRDDQVSKLRLMTQPLVRFESKKHKVIDGAIFAYSIATDPEVLLLLVATSNHAWQYALVRSTNLKLVGYTRGKQTWSQDANRALDQSMLGQSPFISLPYTSFHPTPDKLFRAMSK